MNRTDSLLRALALALILPTSGCAFLSMRSPSVPASPSEPVQCTTDPAAPLFDAALGTALFAASVWYGSLTALGCSVAGERGSDCPTEPYVGGALLGGTYLASAGYGFLQRGRCREAIARQRQCDPSTGMNCGPLGLPAGTGPAGTE